MIVTVWGRPVTVDVGDRTTSSTPHGTTTPQVCIHLSSQGVDPEIFFLGRGGGVKILRHKSSFSRGSNN